MQPEDRRDTIERYETRLSQYGYSPQALGWGQHGRQSVRFAVLAEAAMRQPASSVLDIGCGFADLYDFLRAQGWQGQYTGVDIVPGLLAVARERHPELSLIEGDINLLNDVPEHDYVIASGIFNARLKQGDNQSFTEQTLIRMIGLARVVVCVDFLSTYVDFQKETAWHTDPAWALSFARRLSRRVALRHDYMPYEFALFIYRQAQVSDQNIFVP